MLLLGCRNVVSSSAFTVYRPGLIARGPHVGPPCNDEGSSQEQMNQKEQFRNRARATSGHPPYVYEGYATKPNDIGKDDGV
jgi:hypothetical protein